MSKKITGEIKRIIWPKNPAENGYIIASFLQEKNNIPISIMGNLINPQIGLKYTFTGDFFEHQKFGNQFKFKTFETHIPQDPVGIFKYLVRICKFVGPAVGNQLIEKYSSSALEILKNDPKKVAQEIKGITEKRAIEISKQLRGNEENEKVMIELESLLNVHGMRKNLALELTNRYSSNAPEKLKQNPYILTEFHCVGFSLADRVALHIGYAPDGIERKKACIMHVITENMNIGGHTWIDEKELLKKCDDLICQGNIIVGLKELHGKGLLIKKNNLWSFTWVYEQEQFIARKIFEFLK